MCFLVFISGIIIVFLYWNDIVHILRNLSVPFSSCLGSLTETITASASSLICFPSQTIEASKARTGSLMNFGALLALGCIVWPWMLHMFCVWIGRPGQFFYASFISWPNICSVKRLLFCVSHTLQPWQHCKYWRLVVLTEWAVGQDVGPRSSCVIAADLTHRSNCECLCEPLCGSSQLRMQTALKWRLRM